MRLVAKTFSWSMTHMAVAIAVAYALTQNWRAALAVGLIEPVFQTLAFIVHERIWTKRGQTPGSPFHSHASPATSAA